MERIRIATVYASLIILAPTWLAAGEGVDVSFSVQSLQIRDKVAVQLPAKTEWRLAAADISTGKSLIDAGGKKTKLFFPALL